MTKSELIAKLSRHYPQLVAKDAEVAVKTILDAMIMSLVKGQRIEIRRFGSFGINYRPPRTGRNPKTGAKVAVPEKYAPHFKPGSGAGMNFGGFSKHGAMTAHLVPAVHSNLAGFPAAGFMLDIGGMRVYLSGDTDLYGDMKTLGERYQANLAIVCVGRRPLHDGTGGRRSCVPVDGRGARDSSALRAQPPSAWHRSRR